MVRVETLREILESPDLDGGVVYGIESGIIIIEATNGNTHIINEISIEFDMDDCKEHLNG